MVGFASLLRDGHDATDDEAAALARTFAERPSAALRVSLAVQGVQRVLLGASTVEGGARDAAGLSPIGRALREAAARRDPTLRAMLLRVGLVGGDTMFLIFIATLVTGLFTPLFPFVTLGGVAVWGFAVTTVNRYLQGLGARQAPAGTGAHAHPR